MSKISRKLRSYFVTGLFSLLPIIITVYVFWATFKWVDGLANNLVGLWFDQRIPGVGFVTFLFLVTLVGVIATNVVGRQFINLGEIIVRRIPLVNTIYSSVKQLLEAFTPTQRKSFTKVVLVEYPRKGIYSVGFVSNEAAGELQRKTKENVLFVLIPTTPNPTSGFLILVPEEDCIPLDLTIEEAFKLIISGGILLPEEN